jgi:NADH dehydrogenase
MNSQIRNKKVLILGSGFGGAYTLRHLIGSLKRNENPNITMVSDTNFALFSPLLHEAAMGAIDPRHIAYPIRKLQGRSRFNFVQASVDKIDLNGRNVITTMGTFDYDYLVMALGSITDMSGLKHRGKSVFTLKTLLDTTLVRNHIIEVFERASVEKDRERRRQLLTFVVAGGGYTGVQLVAELRDFVCKNLVKFYRSINPKNIRIILVEAGKKIMAELHPKLGAYSMKHLNSTGIEVKLKSRVTSSSDNQIEINGKEIVPTSTLLWVAGVAINPQITELDIKNDSMGRVFVNDFMEVAEFDGVYALGDCAHFKNPKSRQAIPPRAHTAVRQAKIVAHNILANIRGHKKKPYNYSQNAEIVSLGSSKAIFRYRGIRIYGFPARLLWLMAYATLTPGRYNRMQIIGDWLWSRVFGRDITFVPLPK